MYRCFDTSAARTEWSGALRNLFTAGNEDGDGEAGGTERTKKKSEKADDFEDAEPDEELREGKLRFRGGRGEAATYDAGDDEDEEAAAAARRQAARRGLGDADEEDAGKAETAQVS